MNKLALDLTRVWICLISLGLCLFSFLLFFNSSEAHLLKRTKNLNLLLGQNAPSESNSYTRVKPDLKIRFPIDHAAHPEFRTEWWYWVGNLKTDQNREFGYQLTFYRFNLGKTKSDRSRWSSPQIYMAHFALTDIQENQFYSTEKISRQVFDLAGTNSSPFRVWLSNWSAQSKDNTLSKIQLRAQTTDYAIEFILEPQKPFVLQGDNGYSRKGVLPTSASAYYSSTNIKTTGSLRIHDQVYNISGKSWLDREWHNGLLEEGVAGWDWFAIQLDDSREIMVARLRRKDGSSHYSFGVYVDPNGRKENLLANDFQLKPISSWESPHTHIIYPSVWNLIIKKYDLNLIIQPKVLDQEHRSSILYWEGAVQVSGIDKSSQGNGYMELTGY